MDIGTRRPDVTPAGDHGGQYPSGSIASCVARPEPSIYLDEGKNLKSDIVRFIDDYSRDVESGDAGILAGAGLSVPAGFVDWKDLLRPLAGELELDVDRETDMVALAQFHVNANGMNRARLHRAVVEAFASDAPPTENHRLLAQLPITTWWTTNYDRLIETALRAAGKVVDVKHTVAQLAVTAPRRDATVYKMHGDVDHPDQAVATRDDYEGYAATRGAFINALAGDLVSKTFLFLGFSFTDPNLDQVLSRLRLTFRENQRRHYAVFRTRTRRHGEDDASFAHAVARQTLVLNDLKRYNVVAVLVEDYSEITEILRELVRRHRRRTVFVSASAADFAPWGEEAVTAFMRSLGAALARARVRIATGLGLGVGNALFTGAIEEVVRTRAGHIEDVIVARPFPQSLPEGERLGVWEDYRRGILQEVGVSLHLFGNKLAGGAVVPADGVRREAEIARELGVATIPVGATGSIAATLAAEALAAPDDLMAHLDAGARAAVATLTRPVDDLQTLVEPIVRLVTTLRTGRS